MGWGYYGNFAPYVPVAQKKAQAVKHAASVASKAGRKPSPVVIQGKITKTFWGNSWCQNLEAYSDYSNRLPRGATYVRNGSVVDLQISEGMISAIVAGSSPYHISIAIQGLLPTQWKDVKRECAGQIGSLVELLQGKLSKSVMEIVSRKGTGLFPKPNEIKMRCSCPDSAGLCKHLAAVMYGIGARLDQQPELLFKLRKVDHLELIADAGQAPLKGRKTTKTKTIAANNLADVFGIEMVEADLPKASAAKTKATGRKAKTVAEPLVAEPVTKIKTSQRKNVKPAKVVSVKSPAVSALPAVADTRTRRAVKSAATGKTTAKSKSAPETASPRKGTKSGAVKKQPAVLKPRSLARSAKPGESGEAVS